MILILLLLSYDSILIASPVYVHSLKAPEGYTRVIYEPGSFSRYLRDLPLKNENKIYSYKQHDLSNQYESLGVVAKSLLFQDDLEQCADFTMRLWAEYHKDTNRLQDLYLYNYSGSKIYFHNQNLSYKKFLRKIFASSNSHSIKKGAKEIKQTELRPGDMFVQNENGGIGHVSIILDHVKSEAKEDLFLIGFSFMPAQEMHIEKARGTHGRDGWFSSKGFIKHLEEKYPYGTPVFRRF